MRIIRDSHFHTVATLSGGSMCVHVAVGVCLYFIYTDRGVNNATQCCNIIRYDVALVMLRTCS